MNQRDVRPAGGRADRNNCQRCGTCCRKGPPGLHGEDRVLYDRGWVGKADLLTLRTGEWVYDNVLEQRIVLKEDMLRLRSKPQEAECLFFDVEGKRCRIYAVRPLECRILNCRDTTELIRIYKQDRLSRWDLIPRGSALEDIMVHHETVCGYERIRHLAAALRSKAAQRSSEVEELWAIIQTDHTIRGSLQEAAGVDGPVLDFLFGRPLTTTLPGFGLDLRKTDQGFRFLPCRM